MTRLSQFLLPTEKQPPSDAEAISHKLMVRAGLVRQMGAAAICAVNPPGTNYCVGQATSPCKRSLRDQRGGIGRALRMRSEKSAASPAASAAWLM